MGFSRVPSSGIAPVFPFPAYVIYQKDLEADLIAISLEELHRITETFDELREDREILGVEPQALGVGGDGQ